MHTKPTLSLTALECVFGADALVFFKPTLTRITVSDETEASTLKTTPFTITQTLNTILIAFIS